MVQSLYVLSFNHFKEEDMFSNSIEKLNQMYDSGFQVLNYWR
jgi:hypothetical protein